MPFHAIQHADDPRLQPYALTRDRDAAGPSARPGLFVGESPLVVQAMLERPGCTQSLLIAPRHQERAQAMLDARAPGQPEPPVFVAPDALLETITGFNIHRGFLAIGARPPQPALPQLLPPAPQPAALLCIEGVNNMDNIGQLFRVAAAMGCCGVLLSPDCHDPLYRKSLRVSCGCALRVPFARSTSWHSDLQQLHATHHCTLIGATGRAPHTVAQAAAALSTAPAAPTAPATSTAPVSVATPARRIALLVGAEYVGLQPATLHLCQMQVRIPMAPGVDSLNVAVAAAVCLDRLAPERS